MDVKTGRVTGRTNSTNKDGADTVRLLQVMITDRSDVQTVQLASLSGDESNPPDGSMVSLVAAGPALKIAVAVADRVTPIMAPGGRRVYSTDDTGATVKSELRLDPDGTVRIINPGATITISPSGAVTIDAGGEIVVNSSKTTFNGDVTVSGTITGQTEVVAAGINGSTHVHPENDSGGPTDGPINP